MNTPSAFALLVAILCATPFHRSFAACAVHTGGPQKSSLDATDDGSPHFDGENYLTGDWFGFRNTLYEHGIEITASYATEPAGNPTGGQKKGFTYLHNVALGVQLDLEKIVGIPDTTILITASQRSGRSLTQDDIGNAISVQQLFGGGQTYRLVQVRVDQELFDGRLRLSYGRLSATSDFLTSPFYCQFVTNAICGQPTAPFFNMPDGLTAYPAATWAAVARFKTTPETYVMLGLYDGDPTTGDDTHGVNFGWGDNGVLLMAEIGYKPKEGLLSMPARYSLGGFYHSGKFPDVAQDAFMTNLFLSGLPGAESPGQYGIYTIVEQMLHRNPSRPETGLNGFLTFVASPNQQKSDAPYFMNAGLIYEGLIPGRPRDKAALGMYSMWFSNVERRAQQAAGVPSQNNETGYEVNYQVQITPYLYLRPEIQYIVNPNGLAGIGDALVLGVELGVTF